MIPLLSQIMNSIKSKDKEIDHLHKVVFYFEMQIYVSLEDSKLFWNKQKIISP